MTDAPTSLPEHLQDVLASYWKVFREHHPVGAYFPVSQLDGDCRCGHAWPCETVQFVLAPLMVPDPTPAPDESRKRLATAWSAFLDLAMEATLDDGRSVLEAVLDDNPKLRNRLRETLDA